MADNYLEKRMEQLRHPEKKLRPSRFKGIKVLIIGPGEYALREAAEYADKGNRTALAQQSREKGQQLAYSAGIRFIPLENYAEPEVVRALTETLRAWRGVDTVLLCDLPKRTAKSLSEAWKAYHERYPRTSSAPMTLLLAQDGHLRELCI